MPTHREVTTCSNCPCYSDGCIPSCGINPQLYFGRGYDAETQVHSECPLKEDSMYLRLHNTKDLRRTPHVEYVDTTVKGTVCTHPSGHIFALGCVGCVHCSRTR